VPGVRPPPLPPICDALRCPDQLWGARRARRVNLAKMPCNCLFAQGGGFGGCCGRGLNPSWESILRPPVALEGRITAIAVPSHFLPTATRERGTCEDSFEMERDEEQQQVATRCGKGGSTSRTFHDRPAELGPPSMRLSHPQPSQWGPAGQWGPPRSNAASSPLLLPSALGSD